MNEPGSLPVLASVVFIRITEFARRPVPEQARLRAQLESAVAVSLMHIVNRRRIVLDAPDGMVIAVLDDPAGALEIARNCMSAGAAGVSMAVAINHGAIRLAPDDNGHQGLIGDAVGTASAIAHFAGPGRLFVSRSFREALAADAPAHAIPIRPAGIFTDANVRTHELFAPDAASALNRRRTLIAVGIAVIGAAFVAMIVFHDQVRRELRAGQPATLAFNLYPDGDVFVDNVSRGRSPPLSRLKLDPGIHTVEVKRKGDISYHASVDLQPGRTTTVDYAFAPGGERSLVQILRDALLP